MAGAEAAALGFSPAAALRGSGAGAGADAANYGGRTPRKTAGGGRVLVGAVFGAAGGRSGSGGEPPRRAAAAVNKVGGWGRRWASVCRFGSRSVALVCSHLR